MKIIIAGKAASGKDFLLSKFKEKGYTVGIKYTTRPMRDGEIENESYYYINNSKFNKLINTDKMFVYQSFDVNGQTWKYGFSHDEMYNKSVFILTPEEISQIKKEDRQNYYIVYLNISRITRQSRLEKRSDNNDNYLRRMEADENDFREFSDYDIEIKDARFDIDTILDLIYKNKKSI